MHLCVQWGSTDLWKWVILQHQLVSCSNVQGQFEICNTQEPSNSLSLHGFVRRRRGQQGNVKLPSNLQYKAREFPKLKRFVSRPEVVFAQSIETKSRMKMQLEQRRHAMLQLHLLDQQLYSHKGAAYVRGLTVFATMIITAVRFWWTICSGTLAKIYMQKICKCSEISTPRKQLFNVIFTHTKFGIRGWSICNPSMAIGMQVTQFEGFEWNTFLLIGPKNVVGILELHDHCSVKSNQ